MPFLDSTMNNSGISHWVQTQAWHCRFPSLTSRWALWAELLHSGKTLSPGLPSNVWVATLPPCYILMALLIQYICSLPGPDNSPFWLGIHPQAGAWLLTQLCLAAHSKVLHGIQQSICRVYGHAQLMFLQFCQCYSLLPIPADQETLLYFATFLVNTKGLQHGTITSYLYGVWALHIDMGLSDPLKGMLSLHICLWAIHIQSHPESHKLAFMYDLLVLVQPLYQFPAQQVLWAALTMAHFGLLQTGEFTVDQEHFNLTWHLCIQDVMPSLSAQSELQHVTICLKISKKDPFRQGVTHDYWLLWHSGLWGLHSMGPYTVALGKTGLPNSTIPPSSWPATLYRHFGGPHQRPPGQMGTTPCFQIWT